MGKISAPTIFFGGGTPSLMPTQIFDKIMSRIHQRFNIDPMPEVSLESNPGTLDATRLREFINAGVNRLSIGVQSLDDEKLKFLGRRHSANDARKLIDAAMNAHIRISADFIYATPGEGIDDVIKTCRDINQLGLRHASMYELTIEENTPFGKMNLDMPSNDQMAEMYMAIEETLNLPRYEVSNYATPGHECTHNQNIWDGAPYIGIGRGAAGRVFIDNTWYQQMGAGAEFTPISNSERATEMIITGMRTSRGVKINHDITDTLNLGYIKEHPELFIRKNDDRISASGRGMLILDELLTNMIK